MDRATILKEWAAFDAASTTSFFTSARWIGTWLSILPPEIEPLWLRASLGEKIVAMAILIRRRLRRRFVIMANQVHLNTTGDPRLDCLGMEHNGFASSGVDPHVLWAAFLAWFRAGAAGGDELVINGLAQEDATKQIFAASGLFHRNTDVPSFLVDLAAVAHSGGDPGAHLTRNSRQQLRHAMRLCSSEGVLSIDQAKNVDEALAFFTAMKPLHIAHWIRRGKPHAFVHPNFEIFHRALIAAGIAEAAVQLLRIRAGRTLLGYLYNFRHRGRVYAYQSGFEARERWRVGYVCHALAIQHAALQGDLAYDFMAGDNRLKRSFSSGEYRMGWHVLQRPRVLFGIENNLRAARRSLERTLHRG